MVYYQFEYQKYVGLLGEDGSETDSKAMADMMAIIGGQRPDVPEAPTKKYLFTLERFLNSNRFKELDEQMKSTITEFIQMVSVNAKEGIGDKQEPSQGVPQEVSQEGTPQEMPPEMGMPQEPSPTVPGQIPDISAMENAPIEQGPEQVPPVMPIKGNVLKRSIDSIMKRFGLKAK
jgi:hypothetical protein